MFWLEPTVLKLFRNRNLNPEIRIEPYKGPISIPILESESKPTIIIYPFLP